MKNMKWIIGLALVLLLVVGLTAGAMATENVNVTLESNETTYTGDTVDVPTVKKIIYIDTIPATPEEVEMPIKDFDVMFDPKGNDPINVGSYTVIVKGKDPFDSFVGSTTYSITPATVTAPTAIANLTYNGTAQAIATAGSTSASSNYEILYSIDGTNYSTEIPTVTNAIENGILYYKVAKKSTAAATVPEPNTTNFNVIEETVQYSIAQAPMNLSAAFTTTAKTVPYTGTAADAPAGQIKGSIYDSYTEDWYWTPDYIKVDAVLPGQYYAVAKIEVAKAVQSNYMGTAAISISSGPLLTIEPATLSVSWPTATETVYSGDEVAFSTTGCSVSGGTGSGSDKD